MKKINDHTSAQLDQVLNSLPTDLQDAMRELYAAQTKLEIINAGNWARVLMLQEVKKLSHTSSVLGVDMASGPDQYAEVTLAVNSNRVPG